LNFIFVRAFLDRLYRVADLLLHQPTPDPQPAPHQPDHTSSRLHPPPTSSPTHSTCSQLACASLCFSGCLFWPTVELANGVSRQLTRKRFFDLFLKRKRRRRLTLLFGLPAAYSPCTVLENVSVVF
jgi:hypothetical protein